MKEVQVKISLKDAFSTALKAATTAAKNELRGLANTRLPLPRTAPLSNQSGNIGLGTIAAGNLLSTAISSVASGVTSAGATLINAIGNQVTEAAQANRSSINSAGAIRALLDVTDEVAQSIQSSSISKFTELARKLPGETSDYLDTFNGLSDTLILAGGLTKDGLNDAGTELVTAATLLSQSTGKGSQQTATDLGKLMEAKSAAILSNDTFQNNPAFKAAIEKQMKTAGSDLDGFFQLAATDRMKVLNKASASLNSKADLDRMANSLDSQIGTLQSDLFGVQGLFGFMRKIKMPTGDTTIFAELGKTFSALTKAGTAIVTALGLADFDPLIGLAQWLRSVSDVARQVTQGLQGGMAGVGAMLAGIWERVTSTIMGTVFNLLASVKSSGGFSKLGESVGQVLGTVGAALAEFGGRFMAEHGAEISVGIFQFAQGVGQGLLSKLPELATGLGTMVIGVLQSVAQSFAGIQVAIVQAGLDAAGKVGSGLLGAIGQFIGAIKSGFESGIAGVGAAIAGVFEQIKSQIASLASNAVAQVGSAAMSASVPGGKATVDFFSWAGKQVGIGGKYSGNHTNLLDRLGEKGDAGLGTIGTAFQGNLLDAIATENRMKPSGSSLMIANSSELIVPRDKVRQMSKSEQPVVFNIAITANTLQQMHQKLDAAVRRLPGISTV